MLKLITGVFVVLHGLVHLLYTGQSLRRFELRPGMAWPDGSWAFSIMLGADATRSLAGVLYALAALGFVIGGAGTLAGQVWSRPLVVGSAAFSAVIVVLFWDGKLHRLDDQGGIALLINVAIWVAAVMLRWPRAGG